MFTPKALRLGMAVVGCAALIFALGGCARTSTPTVSSTNPAGGATAVPLNTMISATFSEEMDPETITPDTFTLTRAGTPVPGAVAYSGVTATFTPATNLAPNTLYTATITTGAEALGGMLKCDSCNGPGPWLPIMIGGVLIAGAGVAFHSQIDNALEENFVWTFTTGAALDKTAPTVSSTDPAAGAVGVSLTKVIGRKITATFSEAMDPATITPTTFTLAQGTVPVSGSVTYSGVTAVFTPTDALAPTALFTATITTGAKDLAGNALAADYVWTFTTGIAPDTTPPTVSSTDPADGATDVSVADNEKSGKKISATFSEAMDPLTISTATFTLAQGTTPVPGTVTYAGVTAAFSPTSDLAYDTLYTATITTGAEDLAGNALATSHVWTFTTGAAPDTTPPTVTFTNPAQGATNVPVNKKIAATFSEAMDPLTINTVTFTLMQGDAPDSKAVFFPRGQKATPVSGAVTYTGVTAVFSPTTPLANDTEYTATITTGAADLSGNALAGSHVWTFTTGEIEDSTAPRVTSTAPANGATAVPVNKKIAATFSEAMDPLTVTTATFTLAQGTTPVPGAVVYAGVTAIFSPTGGLAPSTLYTATIAAGAEDLAGNALAGDYVWTFTTAAAADATAPTVSSTNPADAAINVPVNKKVSATFSEAMDPLTVTTATFRLAQGTTPVPGAVVYAGVTAVFTPTGGLAPNTLYTATIMAGAEDLAGNALASDYVWTFTTADAADATAPTVISTDPADTEINVPINKKIAATFSEAMDPLTVNAATFTLYDGAAPVLGAVTYAGVTATFAPLGGLVPNTLYMVTITDGAEDLAGNPLASDYAWSFTTGAAPDNTAPAVISTDPIDGAAGVPINKTITATFSEIMDTLTVTTATFTLEQGTTPVSGSVTYSGLAATFVPAGGLEANATYTATVWMEAEDLAGNTMASDHVWTFTTGATAGQAPIDLGTAGAFAILAGATVTSTGPSIVNGDLGVSPGAAVIGFPPATLNGSMFTGVASAAGQAKLDLTVAFNDAAGRSVGNVSLPGDLSGLTLYPGLYTNSTSVMLSAGNLTLDAQGDGNAVFIFQMGSTLTTGSGTQVILSGGAKAGNIYWQVGTSATLGTTSIFKGNILASASITLATGATLDGRALTQVAAVSLDASTITVPAP